MGRRSLAAFGAFAVLLTSRSMYSQSQTAQRRDIASASQDTGYIDLLRDAVGELKRRDEAVAGGALNGWRFLASTHKFWCFNDDVDFEIHFSSSFFPWHRAYLQRMEKALQSAVREPSLRLPYWNWSNNRRLPEVFSARQYSKNGALRDNPLFNSTRYGSVGQGGDVRPSNELDITSQSAFADFGGTADAPGSLELGHHGHVHNAVGGRGPNGQFGDMADQLSSNDPIFFAHHANIDRLWSKWRRRWPGADPQEPAWSERKYALMNPDTLEFEIFKTADMLETRNLPSPYIYDDEAGPGLSLVQQVLDRTRISGRVTSQIDVAGQTVSRFQLDAPSSELGRLQLPAVGAATVVVNGLYLADGPQTIEVSVRDPQTNNVINIGTITLLGVRGRQLGRMLPARLPVPEAALNLLSTNPRAEIVIADDRTIGVPRNLSVTVER